MRVVVVPIKMEPQLRYSLETGWPENPELWVSEETASNPEELNDILEKANRQWIRATAGEEEARIERQMIDRLIAFDNWARANAGALREMRMKEEEDEENGIDESYSRD